MQLRTEQRAFRSRWSLIFGFLLGVFVGVVATEVVCRGALEFVCDALDFQNLPIGDSKTLLHILPISRLREFAIDAERFLLYARLAVCVEVALDRVACIR